jgi:hypothetical protein
MPTITIGNGNITVDEGVLTGTTLDVGNGNDSITLDSGSTNDIVNVGGGTDTLNFYNLSHSTITLGNGSITLIANGDGNTINAGSGSYTITAEGNNDTIALNDGFNTINMIVGTGGSGDHISIGNGNDTVIVGANSTVGPNKNSDNGKDMVTAGPNSTVTLGNGQDTVFAGANSTITLGNGTGAVHAGTSDLISIGNGADLVKYDGLTPTFTVPASLIFNEEGSIAFPITIGPPALGNEVVNGFRTQQDVIAFDKADFPDYATVKADSAQVGPDVVITLDASDKVTLTNVSLANLSAANFQFFTGATDTITITGVPLDETLSAGMSNGAGVWTLSPSQLAGLTLNAGEPIGFPTPVDLKTTVTNPAGQMASATQDTNLTVNAIPPSVSDTVLAPHTGDPVTETRLNITAAPDDPDGGNDAINRVALSGIPSGVTLSHNGVLIPVVGGSASLPGSNFGGGSGGSYEVDVTTPPHMTTNFNLGIQAFADEPNSPEQSASTTQNIDVEYSTVQKNPDFLSTGQSIWKEGGAFSTSIHKFLGVDFPPGFTTDPSQGYPNVPPFSKTATVLGSTFGVTFGLKAGFQSDLNINAGTFNGSLPFTVTLDDTYNKTNDTLQIEPSAQQGIGTFNTVGPSGSFDLDLILDAFFKALVGPLGTLGPYSTNITDPIVNLDSSSPPKKIDLPDGIGTVTFAFPNVDVSASGAGSTISNSNQALVFQVKIDPIAVALDAIVGSDPLKGSTSASIGPIPLYSFSYTILKGTVAPSLNFGQTFTLTDNGLTPVLKTANGTTEPLAFGSPTVIDNASSLDTSPGTIAFNLGLTPNTTLENDSSLIGQLLLALKALGIHGSIAGIGGGTGPFTLFSHTFNLGSKSLYDKTFPVAFNPQTVNFSVS